MKFSKIAVFLVLSSAFSLTPEEITTKVGDGCSNIVSFSSSFLTGEGSPCTSCGFCSGSALHHLFDPKKSFTCVECGTKENSCYKFRVMTTFDKAWKMSFFSIFSSDASQSDDPKRIVVAGSNNHDADGSTKTWITLYDSDQESGVDFSARSSEKVVVFNNNQEFKHYAISFDRKADSSEIYIGNYGLIQSYTKECASKVYKDLTGTTVLPYVTLAPTSAPTERCVDTPGWSNGYRNGCAVYAKQGWCANGAAKPGQEWTLGGTYRYPELNCCVCGK